MPDAENDELIPDELKAFIKAAQEPIFWELSEAYEAAATLQKILEEKKQFPKLGQSHLTTHDEAFMREAIRLSESAVEHGNEPFGAILVKGGEVLLRIENTIFTERDMTNHAEMNLVRAALRQYAPEFLRDCTLYTSTEPCAMCAGAIYWSGIGRMIYACSEDRLTEIAGAQGLAVPSRTVLHSGGCKVEVIGPLLEDEAAQIHLRYWTNKLV